MKKKLLYLIGVIIAISLLGAVLINAISKSTDIKKKEEEDIDIVASFYPMYIIGLNLLDGIEEFNVSSLTSGYIGCLHDYQLTTEDMKKISSADIFLMNGGGMENFMDTVMDNYPSLYTMNTSNGITMLTSDIEAHFHENEAVTEGQDDHSHDEDDHSHDEDDHSHDEDDHSHSEYNAHVWLDPQRYILQIENAKAELIHYIDDNTQWDENKKSEIIEKLEINAVAYLEKVQEVDQELIAIMNNYSEVIVNENKEGVVVFHDAFVYIADRIGLNVTRSIEIEQDTQLSAREIAQIVDEINEDKIKYLFTEKQYGQKIADQIQAETGVKIYQIDSAVTGDSDKNAYIAAMEFNLEVLKEVLQ